MSEHVYDLPIHPDLAMEVRHGRGEMEERGEREERVVDIYVSTDGPDPGTPQHAVQKNTAQEQRGDSNETKKKLRLAGLFLVLLCVLLLAVIIGLVINNKEKKHNQSSFDQLQSSCNNLTDNLVLNNLKWIKEKNNNLTKDRDELQSSLDQLESRYKNLTEEQDQLETRYNNVTEEKDQLETRYNNVTEEKDQLQFSFDQLQTSYNKLMEQDDTKRIICETNGFTLFGGLCYHISTEKKNWRQSRRWCTDKQSDLMVINSKEKQDFVVSLRHRMWLGLTDREVEGNWTWVDGTHELNTSEYWSPNQPDNSGNCVESRSARGGWNVRPCGNDNRWICERVIN